MPKKPPPEAYETYIIHCWQEKAEPEPIWRFRLTVVSSGRAYGFISAAELILFWHKLRQKRTPSPSTPPPPPT